MTSKGQDAWEAAGLMDVEGRYLGSPALTEGEVVVPQEVALEGESLLWRFTRVDDRRPTVGMLDAILRVRTAVDALRYVKSFGPLSFCARHRLPVGHNSVPENPFIDDQLAWQIGDGRPWDPLPPEVMADYCVVDRVPGSWNCVERASSYVRLAEQLRAVCNIAAGLKTASAERLSWTQIGSEDDWRALSFGQRGRPYSVTNHRTEPQPGERPVPGDLYLARQVFGTELRILLGFSRVRPNFLWLKDREPRFVIEADNFGALMLQLIHAVCGTHGLAVCSGCGSPYTIPGRQPQRGRRNYCEACRLSRVPERDAKRDQRARARR